MATGFNTQVGNGEYRLQFETDNKEHYLLMQETARRCVDGKLKTKADLIRSMSDEELADIMSMHTATGACNDWGIPHEKCGGNCRECIIDWLKQPAEVK